MASTVASRPGRGLLVWCLAAFPLIGAVLPYVVQVCVYARVGSVIGERPGADPLMIFNAAPFVVVTLLSLGQLSSGVGRWISSVAMILIGAASMVWLLNAPSWWILLLPAISMVAVALTAWYGDAAVRRAGIIGSGIGVFGLSVLWNAALWRTVFLRLPGFSNWPIGFIFNIINNVLFAGVLLGYLGGVIVYVLVGVAARLRPDVARPDRP